MAVSTQTAKTAYDSAMENFDLAADALDLSLDVRNTIKYPDRITFPRIAYLRQRPAGAPGGPARSATGAGAGRQLAV